MQDTSSPTISPKSLVYFSKTGWIHLANKALTSEQGDLMDMMTFIDMGWVLLIWIIIDKLQNMKAKL